MISLYFTIFLSIIITNIALDLTSTTYRELRRGESPSGILLNEKWTCQPDEGQCGKTGAFWLLSMEQLDDCRKVSELDALKWQVNIDVDCAAREWPSFKILVDDTPVRCDNVEKSPSGGADMIKHCNEDPDLIEVLCEWSCNDPSHEGLAGKPELSCTIEVDRTGKLGLKSGHVAECKIVDGDCKENIETHSLVCSGYDLDDISSHSPYDNPIPAIDHNIYLCNATSEWQCLFCHAHLNKSLEAIQPGCPFAKKLNGLYGPGCYSDGDEEQICYSFKHEEGDADCEGDWGPWTVCDSACAQYQAYSVISEVKGNGSRCPYPDGYSRKKDCSHGLCASKGCEDDARIRDIVLNCESVIYAKTIVKDICNQSVYSLEKIGFQIPKSLKSSVLVKEICPIYCDDRGKLYLEQGDEAWHEAYSLSNGRVSPECICSNTGIINGVDSKRPGCGYHIPSAPSFCYVEGPSCALSKLSPDFNKLHWRDCDINLEGDFDGPCACATTQVIDGTDTGSLGCAYHRSDVIHPFCYVKDASKCDSHFAVSSKAFKDLKWRRCVTSKIPDFLNPHPSVNRIMLTCNVLALSFDCDSAVMEILKKIPSAKIPTWFPTNYENNELLTVKELCPVSCGVCKRMPDSPISQKIPPLNRPQLPWKEIKINSESPTKVDCLGEWTPWSRIKCGEGFTEKKQERQWRPSIWPAHGGSICPVEPFTTEARSCEEDPTLQSSNGECKATWDLIEECNRGCVKVLEYNIKSGSDGCFFDDKSRQSMPCKDKEGRCIRTDKNNRNCVAKGWVNDGVCNLKKCTQSQHYEILTHASGNGEQCEFVDGLTRKIQCENKNECECHGSWNERNSCSRTNDGSCMQIVIFEERSGESRMETCSLDSKIGDTMFVPCQSETCYADKDCVGNWSKKNECDRETCFVKMTYLILENRVGLGSTCPYSDGAQDLRICDNDCVGAVPHESYGYFTLELSVIRPIFESIQGARKITFASELRKGLAEATGHDIERFNVIYVSHESGLTVQLQIRPSSTFSDSTSSATIVKSIQEELGNSHSSLRQNIQLSAYLEQPDMQSIYFSVDDEMKDSTPLECPTTWTPWNDKDCFETTKQLPTQKRQKNPSALPASGDCDILPPRIWEERVCPFHTAHDVDCSGIWIEVDKCSSQCIKISEYRIVNEARGNGGACIFRNGARVTSPCTDCQPKEVMFSSDCEAEGWKNIGNCKNCEITQEFIVKSPHVGNGEMCIFDHKTTRRTFCDWKESCECQGDWSSWSLCKRGSNGECSQSSIFEISHQSESCSKEGSLVKHRACDENECVEDVDCDGSFVQLDDCKSCMAWSQFIIKTNSRGNGKTCTFEHGFLADMPCPCPLNENEYANLKIRMTPDAALQKKILATRDSISSMAKLVERSLANSLKQPIERFNVFKLLEGSIIIDLEIKPPVTSHLIGAEDLDASQIVAQIFNQISNPESSLRNSPVKDLFSSAKLVALAYVETPYLLPFDHSSLTGNSNGAKAVIVVTVIILVTLAIILLMICALRQCKDRKESKNMCFDDRSIHETAPPYESKLDAVGWWTHDENENTKNEKTDTPPGARTLGKAEDNNVTPQTTGSSRWSRLFSLSRRTPNIDKDEDDMSSDSSSETESETARKLEPLPFLN
eukprot:GHVL01017532.1.p1 GENE.GHVL01017532.1~~GHVL01017532.1.p1  ORF type:complete len:1643 (-),score=304.90 GHVL01017532.1:114-5042(-)